MYKCVLEWVHMLEHLKKIKIRFRKYVWDLSQESDDRRELWYLWLKMCFETMYKICQEEGRILKVYRFIFLIYKQKLRHY